MRTLIWALVSVVDVTLAGCGSSTPEPTAFTVSGSVELQPGAAEYTDNGEVGATCVGIDSFTDIAEGAPITVRNAAGKKVALGELRSGYITKAAKNDGDVPCKFTFDVTGVKDRGKIFSIQIGDREQVDFKRSQASALNLDLG